MANVIYNTTIKGPAALDAPRQGDIYFEIRWTDLELLLQVPQEKVILTIGDGRFSAQFIIPGHPRIEVTGTALEIIAVAEEFTRAIHVWMAHRCETRQQEINEAKVKAAERLRLETTERQREAERQRAALVTAEEQDRLNKLKESLKDHPQGDIILRFRLLELD